MNFFDYHLFKKTFWVKSVVVVAAGLLGLRISKKTSISLFILGVVFLALELFFEFRRGKEIKTLTKDLSKVLYEEAILPVASYEEGELSILRNEIYKMTMKLREQKENLLDEKTYLGDSLADISHQIKTPLTSLNLINDLLMDDILDGKKRQELLRDERRLLNQIEWLISSLLKISKLDAETITMEKKKVLVKELFLKCQEALSIVLELRGQELILELTGEESFQGDYSWSLEALINLLKNAMEHTPDGGKIILRSLENHLYTEIQVINFGEGISKKDLPHIFERFYRGEHQKSQSFGIGLALTKMIVVKQGGVIKVTSNENEGTIFTLRFYKSII